MSCCRPDEYASVFSARAARRRARRFRRRGITGTAAELIRLLSRHGLDRVTVIEVGAGPGDLQIALLEAGAARVDGVELSPSWEEAAEGLIGERGWADRATRHLGDFVRLAPTLPAADVVVMHRVVCCYPDWEAILEAAVSRARRSIALTFPEDRWWNRLVVGLGNAFLRWRGAAFRSFVHDPEAMLARLSESGFERVEATTGPLWRNVVVSRTAG